MEEVDRYTRVHLARSSEGDDLGHELMSCLLDQTPAIATFGKTQVACADPRMIPIVTPLPSPLQAQPPKPRSWDNALTWPTALISKQR